MGAILPLIVTVLEGLLPIIGGATTGQIHNVVMLLEGLVPVVVQEAQDLIQPIQNIIAQLTNSGAVTADQIALLQKQSDDLDAALDAAAKADGLGG